MISEASTTSRAGNEDRADDTSALTAGTAFGGRHEATRGARGGW
jgi:hypothetical protein